MMTEVLVVFVSFFRRTPGYYVLEQATTASFQTLSYSALIFPSCAICYYK